MTQGKHAAGPRDRFNTENPREDTVSDELSQGMGREAPEGRFAESLETESGTPEVDDATELSSRE